jgi:hypothetical protein
MILVLQLRIGSVNVGMGEGDVQRSVGGLAWRHVYIDADDTKGGTRKWRLGRRKKGSALWH